MIKWWKIAGFILVLYSILAGLIIPLKPGILNINPGLIYKGTISKFKVKCSNTNFDYKTNDIKCWLKFDSIIYLESDSIKVLSKDEIEINFNIPSVINGLKKIENADLIISDKLNGTYSLPEAIFFRSDSMLKNEKFT